MYKKARYLLSIILTIGLFSACSGRNSAQSQSSGYMISITAGALTVGTTDLLITVQDKAGNLINNAHVNIKGSMTHAGMQSVLGETSLANNGVYTIPYEWTMAGDWFVTVNVTLSDGTAVTEQFDFNGIGIGK
ncbi:MAG: hypothetical protein ACI9EW_000079 [Cellvibrionaceae bacterium]|jgi:hypothetical protein